MLDDYYTGLRSALIAMHKKIPKTSPVSGVLRGDVHAIRNGISTKNKQQIGAALRKMGNDMLQLENVIQENKINMYPKLNKFIETSKKKVMEQTSKFAENKGDFNQVNKVIKFLRDNLKEAVA